MRTYIYVDGFNLYYRSLKQTPFKWLDLSGLFRTVLQSRHDILKIKFFTARVSSRPNDLSKPQRQDTYLRALERHCPEVEVYFGHFLTHKVQAVLAGSGNRRRLVDVVRTEEKGSDVNLAVHLLNDAWLNNYDCAVLVTNDSDIAEALRLVRKHKRKLIGLITPGTSRTSKELRTHADFLRRIRTSALKRNQLPSPIPGTSITKPANW